LDGREWLFDTELPSLADISVYFIYSWIQLFWKKGLFDTQKFPKSLEVNPGPLLMNDGDWHHVDSGFLVALSFLSTKELLALKRQICLVMTQLSSSPHRLTSHTTLSVSTKSKQNGSACRQDDESPLLQMTQVSILQADKTIGFWHNVVTGKKHPTLGKLVALNQEEFVLEAKGSTGSVIRCHFPRLGFSIRDASDLQTKLWNDIFV
jgi:hypothetical protein